MHVENQKFIMFCEEISCWDVIGRAQPILLTVKWIALHKIASFLQNVTKFCSFLIYIRFLIIFAL